MTPTHAQYNIRHSGEVIDLLRAFASLSDAKAKESQ
jgi:hypothetical protein